MFWTIKCALSKLNTLLFIIRVIGFETSNQANPAEAHQRNNYCRMYDDITIYFRILTRGIIFCHVLYEIYGCITPVETSTTRQAKRNDLGAGLEPAVLWG